MEPVTGSIFILPFSPSGTLQFPSVFAPTELITPPTMLKIPATKLSANCVKNAFKLSVKNILVKK